MTILEQVTTGQIEAADSRFFNNSNSRFELESPNDFFMFSRDFWGRYADLIPAQQGLVLQTNFTEGEASLCDERLSRPNFASLYFDSLAQDKGIFDWHLTVATPGDGRTEHKITTSRHMNNLRAARFDVQGRAKEIEPNPRVCELVMRLALGEEVVERAKILYVLKRERERELSQFSVNAINKYSADLYERKLKDLQDRADSTGFGQCTPLRW